MHKKTGEGKAQSRKEIPLRLAFGGCYGRMGIINRELFAYLAEYRYSRRSYRYIEIKKDK